MSAARIIGLAGLLGALTGVALSFKRQHDDERELAQMAEQAKKLAGRSDPGTSPLRSVPRASAPQIDPETVEGIPTYPNTNPQDLAGSLKGQGMEMKVGWFETTDAVEQVLRFYQQKFREAGRFSVIHRYNANAGYVGFLDLNDEKLHLVTVMRNHNKTLVFPSASYPGKFLAATAQVPPSVPVLPGAQGSVVFDFDEGNQSRRSYFATVGDRSVAEVAAFYRAAFIEKGWILEEAKQTEASEARIDARKGQGTCNVLVQKRAQKVAIYVSIAGQV